MNRYKKSGWYNESQRHSLAAQGIKTGRKGYSPVIKPINYAEIKEIRKATTYTDGEFEYTFSPIEDTIQTIKVPDGYVVKYLAQDNDPESPDSWGDDSLFLVHYHRNFQVENNNIITEDDARDWYQGNKIEQEKKFWIIPIEAYIHSGVSLAVQNEGNFPDRRWDVSHVGLALASKEEFKTKKQAEKSVKGLVESWNEYLGGDVYSVVAEKYNDKKEQIDYDVVGGYYGIEAAKEELKSFEYGQFTSTPQKKVTDFARKKSPFSVLASQASNKLKRLEVKSFFKKAFGYTPKDDAYLDTWVGRFESPVRVWSYSDYDRRRALKKIYPEKFGNLDKDANLNNPEYQIEKFQKW